MAKKDSVSEEVEPEGKPFSVTITVKQFNNILSSDNGKSAKTSRNDLTNGNSPPENKLVLANEKSSSFTEVDFSQSSNALSTELTRASLRTDSQRFQPNEKITKVLLDSGPFDNINNTQVLQHRLRALEIEKLALVVDHNNLIRKYNSNIENHFNEVRKLNEINEASAREIQELRDLTCFLDDERTKFKKIAKEWRKFGQNTVDVLKNEVISYQEKLAASEGREKALINENKDLRDLCARLDNGRLSSSPVSEKSNNIKQLGSSQGLHTPKNGRKTKTGSKSQTTTRDIYDRRITSPKHARRREDIYAYSETSQPELHNVQMSPSTQNRLENKKVKFDFPDDSDTSAVSDRDIILDFPPTFAEFDKISKLSKAFPELNISGEDSEPVDMDRILPKTNILSKFNEENLSNDHLFFPTSPKRTVLNTVESPDGLHSSDTTKGNGRNDLTDSDISTTSTPTSSSVFHDICRGGGGGNSFDSSFDRDPYERSEYV